jgi:hypothetical protein
MKYRAAGAVKILMGSYSRLIIGIGFNHRFFILCHAHETACGQNQYKGYPTVHIEIAVKKL